MGNLFNRESRDCQSFRDALEAMPVSSELHLSVENLLEELPEEMKAHGVRCEACRATLEEFVETRNALAGMSMNTPQAGPWFTARVMSAIAAKEREDEARDGVWISVRRLAPRLVAVSALLLVLGGSWALEQSQRNLPTADRRGGDLVFDSSAVPPSYDDGLGTINEVRP